MRYFQNLILTQFLLDLQRGRFHDALAMVLLGGIEVSQYTYDEFPEYRAFVDGHVCPVCLDGGGWLTPRPVPGLAGGEVQPRVLPALRCKADGSRGQGIAKVPYL